MARNDPTLTNKTPEPIKPIAPEAEKAAAQVPVIDTAKLSNASQDPRGENRPGVLPDPLQDDIDPITNLRRSQLDPETGTPLPSVQQPRLLNPAPGDNPKAGRAKPPKGRMVKMRAVSDIWPHNKPDDWSDEDKANREYRIPAGQEVELPEEEAMDRMEAGTAVRADRRA